MNPTANPAHATPPTCVRRRPTRCALPRRIPRSPAVMQSYAPNAQAGEDGWVEDDETIHRLMRWREEAIY